MLLSIAFPAGPNAGIDTLVLAAVAPIANERATRETEDEEAVVLFPPREGRLKILLVFT